jgi:hypothetical protein
MADYSQIGQVLKMHLTSLRDLERLGVTTNKKDFTSQIGEWFVSELYDGQRATSGIQKDWDIMVGEKYIQVKTHSKAATTTARWTAVKYNEEAKIDEIITVVFTPDYKLREFYKTPWTEALKLIRRQKDRDVLNWDDQIRFKISIEKLPKQDLVSLFK